MLPSFSLSIVLSCRSYEVRSAIEYFQAERGLLSKSTLKKHIESMMCRMITIAITVSRTELE